MSCRAAEGIAQIPIVLAPLKFIFFLLRELRPDMVLPVTVLDPFPVKIPIVCDESSFSPLFEKLYILLTDYPLVVR
jgi:hypothetical protein